MSPPRPYWRVSTTGDVDNALIVMSSRLHEVKNLFLNRSYKKCTWKCEEHLRSADAYNSQNKIYECYLNFYAGLAYDAFVRNMPHAAPIRQSMLSKAEMYYLAAEASLPQPASTPSHQCDDSDEGLTEDEDEDDHTPPNSQSPSKRNSMYSTYSLGSLITSEGTNSLTPATSSIIEHYFALNRAAKPPPLTIRKQPPPSRLSAVSFNIPTSPASVTSPTLSDDPFADIIIPLSASLEPPPASYVHEPTTPTTPDTPNTPNHDFNLNRASTMSLSSRTFTHILAYNAALLSFSQMLHAHIASIRSLSTGALDSDDAIPPLPSSKSTFMLRAPSQLPTSPSMPVLRFEGHATGLAREDQVKKEKERRRKELVGRALSRERFKPERYQELCQRALAEI